MNGESFDESHDYVTVVGMLMYISTNTRPDIAFAVNQCTGFTHNPKKSHLIGVKKVLRYLRGTKDKWMNLNPSGSYNVDSMLMQILLDSGELRMTKILCALNPGLVP